METSQNSHSTLSSRSASPQNSQTRTPQSKLTNGLQFLRSPAPEDFKKKKGWSSSSKSRKSEGAFQESRAQLSSTAVKAECEEATCGGLPKPEPFLDNDNLITYSPLSDFPAEGGTEVRKRDCRKGLFNEGISENDSVELSGDCFSSEDELLCEFIDNLENNSVHASFNTQLDPVNSGSPTNQRAASTAAENRASSSGGKEAHSSSSSAISPCKSSIQSPQSIVLERLRETLQSLDSPHVANLNDSRVNSELLHTTSPQVPSSQTSFVEQFQTMPALRGQNKACQAPCLKQTDIGVFFGLKPLKKVEKKNDSGPSEINSTPVPTLGESSRQRRPRKERGTKKADTTADTSQSIVKNSNVEAGKGRSRGWRGRRWNRVNADGEVELPRCPFYKKIPGQCIYVAFVCTYVKVTCNLKFYIILFRHNICHRCFSLRGAQRHHRLLPHTLPLRPLRRFDQEFHVSNLLQQSKSTRF